MFGLYLLLVYSDDIKRCAIVHNCNVHICKGSSFRIFFPPIIAFLFRHKQYLDSSFIQERRYTSVANNTLH